MYKITFSKNHFFSSEILEPNKIKNKRLGLTNLEIEKENNKSNSNVFFQKEKPTLRAEYWILRSGIVENMTNEEILIKDNEKVNNSFYNKKIKLHIFDLTACLNAGLGNYWIKFNSNSNIIVEKLNEQLLDGIIIMPYNVFLNKISKKDKLSFDNAIIGGLLKKEENPTKEKINKD